MDQTTLLREQFAGGRKVVTALLARGFDLVAAGWAKTPDRERWKLYLVSPAVEATDPRPAYRVVNAALDEMEGDWADAFDRVDWTAVMLIPPSDPLARGLLESARLTRKVARWQDEGMLGDTFVEGAYIYPSALFAKPTPATGN